MTSPGRATPSIARATIATRSSPGRTSGVRNGIAIRPPRHFGARHQQAARCEAHVRRSSTISSSLYFREPLSRTTSSGRTCSRSHRAAARSSQRRRSDASRARRASRHAPDPSRTRRARAARRPYSPRGRQRARGAPPTLRRARPCSPSTAIRREAASDGKRIERGDHAARVGIVGIVDNAERPRRARSGRSALAAFARAESLISIARAARRVRVHPAIAAARFARLCRPGTRTSASYSTLRPSAR